MKKLIIFIILLISIVSCNSVNESKANLSKTLNTNNIYSIDQYEHVVYSDTSIYHYRTTKKGTIKYKFQIK